MKLGGTYGRVVYATRGLTVGTWRPDRGFEPRGRLPNPRAGLQRARHEAINNRVTKRFLGPLVGHYATTNVWPAGERTLLATAGRYLFRSGDGGRSWWCVHTLPAASGPMGVLPTSFCTSDGRLYLAEYTVNEEAARILESDDDGETWTVGVRSEEHRHFHGVFRDPYSDRVWATAGDTDAESAVGVVEDGTFRPVGAGSQRWRAVGLAFTPEAVIWGMDSSFSPQVEILRLPRAEIGAENPEPDTVGTTDSSVFYAETLSVDGEDWVVLATAAETGLDSTAPSGAENRCSRHPRVLAARSTDGYENWRELCSFARRRVAGEYLPVVPSASAYLFLAAAGDRVVINPYNTARRHGTVFTTTPGERQDGVVDGRRRDSAGPVQ